MEQKFAYLVSCKQTGENFQRVWSYLDPFDVRLYRVTRHGDYFNAKLVKHRHEFDNSCQLGCAYGSEVIRMREKYSPSKIPRANYWENFRKKIVVAKAASEL